MAGAWISAWSATSLSRVPAYPFRLSTCAAASRIRSLVRADLELVSSGVATPSFLGTLQIIVPGTDGAGGRAGLSSCMFTPGTTGVSTHDDEVLPSDR